MESASATIAELARPVIIVRVRSTIARKIADRARLAARPPLCAQLCSVQKRRTMRKKEERERERNASRRGIAQVNLPNCRRINQPRAARHLRVAARSFQPNGGFIVSKLRERATRERVSRDCKNIGQGLISSILNDGRRRR